MLFGRCVGDVNKCKHGGTGFANLIVPRIDRTLHNEMDGGLDRIEKWNDGTERLRGQRKRGRRRTRRTYKRERDFIRCPPAFEDLRLGTQPGSEHGPIRVSQGLVKAPRPAQNAFQKWHQADLSQSDAVERRFGAGLLLLSLAEACPGGSIFTASIERCWRLSTRQPRPGKLELELLS